MKSSLKAVIKVSFVVYIILLFAILFLAQRGYWNNLSIFEYASMQMNLIPFKTIIGYIQAIFAGSMNLSIPIKNLLGNFILFLPMGIYIPLFLKKSRIFLPFIMRILIILFIVEIVQFVTRRGAFDIDDLILNLSGAFIGFKLWESKFGQAIEKNYYKE